MDPRRIKVLNLVHGFHGGVARVVAMLSRLNERPGVELRTVVLNNPAALCNRDDLEAYDLDVIPYQGLHDLSWMAPCAEQIRTFTPDLLLVHGDGLAVLLIRLLQRKLPYHPPCVVWNHGYYQRAANERTSLRTCYHAARAWLTPWAYQRSATAIATVAEHAKRYFISHGVDAEKITVIHNGIPSTAPPCDPIPRSSMGVGEDDLVIGTVSRMEPEKGLDYLIDAFGMIADSHPRSHLVIVGGGKCSDQLREQSLRRGIGARVHLFEYQDNTSAWVDRFDVYAIPSLREGHSIALLEAMRAGKAIVASDVPGNKESVEDEKEALLVPPKNPKALARSLDRLLTDHELARRLSEAAVSRFQSYFTLDHMLDDAEKWLARCVEPARPQNNSRWRMFQ